MATPINYTIQPSPAAGGAILSSVLGGFQAANTMAAQEQQRADAERARQREEVKNQELAALMHNWTVEGARQFMTKYPEYANSIKSSLESIGADRARKALMSSTEINAAIDAGKLDYAKATAKKMAEAYRNSGDEELASRFDTVMNAIDVDPKMASSISKNTAVAFADKDLINFYQRQETRTKTFAPDSLAGGLLTKFMDSEGNVHYKLGNTKIPDEQAFAIMDKAEQDKAARDISKTQAKANINVGAAGRIEENKQSTTARYAATIAGDIESAKQAKKMAVEVNKNIGQISGRIALYKQAKEALQGEKSANSGWLASQFPTIQSKSIDLEIIKNSLALNIISGTTFGALSEKELDFVNKTAIPMGKEKGELLKWLEAQITRGTDIQNGYEKAYNILAARGATLESLTKQAKSEKAQGVPPLPDFATTPGQGNLPPLNAPPGVAPPGVAPASQPAAQPVAQPAAPTIRYSTKW